MEWFIRYSGLFFFGGFCGWVIELFFRRFVSQKRWVNPGFLTGPILPLYGFGVAGFYLFANLDWLALTPYIVLDRVLEVLAIGVLMTLIEYVAGLIFIKGMKVKLWDYSNRWGNIDGIICPLFSLIWLVIGGVYIFWLNPFFLAYTNWLIANLLPVGMTLGFFYGILVVDLGWSLGLTARIRKAVADAKLVVDWDKIKVSFQEHYKRLQQSPEWLLPFKTKREEFSSLMNEYLETLRLETKMRQERFLAKQAAKRQKREEKAAERSAKKGEGK